MCTTHIYVYVGVIGAEYMNSYRCAFIAQTEGGRSEDIHETIRYIHVPDMYVYV